MHPLVTVDELRTRLGEPGLVVVDCRWKLGEPGVGEAAWRADRIPGAAFLDVESDLCSPPGARGRHPLPEPGDLEAAARRAGISDHSTVVAYDDSGQGGAARLWWLLRHFGHDHVAILNGGMAAWREASEAPVETGPPAAERPSGDFSARPRTDDVATMAELRERGDALTLLDARAPERYRGEVEPIDPVAGHIPGARNLPFAELAPGGRFADPAELRERLEHAGARAGAETIAYCGSGITASIVVAAAEAAGMPGFRLYPGSWSEWSQTIDGSEEN